MICLRLGIRVTNERGFNQRGLFQFALINAQTPTQNSNISGKPKLLMLVPVSVEILENAKNLAESMKTEDTN